MREGFNLRVGQVGRRAGQNGGASIGSLDDAVLIDHHHGLLDRIEGDLPFRRGTLQLLPHLPLGGDVAVDAEHDHLGGIEHRGVDLQRDLASIAPPAYRLEAVRAALPQLCAQNRRPAEKVV